MARDIPTPPNGYHTVTPYLTVNNATALMAFMETVFGSRVSKHILRPDGKIAHADVRVGDSMIMLADASDHWPAMPAAMYVYVFDIGATYAQAVADGASSIMAPADQFHGDRMSGVRDTFGNVWWIMTHVEHVAADELQRRANAQLSGEQLRRQLLCRAKQHST